MTIPEELVNRWFDKLCNWFWSELMLWHPICKQHFLKYYRNVGGMYNNRNSKQQLKNGKSNLQLISEAGGGKWAKIDWLFMYVRFPVLVLGLVALNLYCLFGG